MRKKIIKKMSAAALSVTMFAISAMSAMAAPEDCIDMNAKASFKIHKYDMTAAEKGGVIIENAGFANNGKADSAAEEALKNYAIQGVEFTYAKIGDVHTDNENGHLQLLYDIPEALETILMQEAGREDNCYTSTELNQALARTLADNTAGKNALEQFIGRAERRQTMPLTDEQGVTGASNLALGLYLVVETKVPANVHTTTDPFFLSLPMTDTEGEHWFYDVDVYPKNQTDRPDLDKLVKQRDDSRKNAPYEEEITASEGDVLDYIFVSHLPNITSQATFLKQYTFVDKMDSGLTYNDDFAIYFYDSEEKAKLNHKEQAREIWKKGSPNFIVEYGTLQKDSGESGKTMRTATVRVTETGLAAINKSLSRMYMTVSYSCTVNSDASAILGDQGNVNEAELTWRRTSSEFPDTIEDRAKVYTYGLRIQKNFEEQDGKKGDPKQVQFVLQNKTDGHYVTAAIGGDGVYYVTDKTKAENEKQAAVFVPAKNGQLLVNGLEADTYVLTEIATDKGYSLLREPILIEIKNAVVELTVLNSRSFKVPQTGDDGILFFPLAGCAAALAGVVLILRKSGKK